MRKLLLLLLLLDLFHSISFIFYLLVSVASMPLCTGKWPFHPLRTLSFETVMELDNCTGSMPSNCIKYNFCWNVTHHNASYRHRIVFCWYYLLICYCYASFLVVLWGHGQTDGRTFICTDGWHCWSGWNHLWNEILPHSVPMKMEEGRCLRWNCMRSTWV